MTVAEAVTSLFGSKEVDEDIVNYVVSCLEDESLVAATGDEIYDTVGPMLVCISFLHAR